MRDEIDIADRGGMIIEVAFLASRLGWPMYTTRRWLVRTGAGRKPGGRWITTPRLLRVHWPEAFDAIEADWLEHVRKVTREVAREVRKAERAANEGKARQVRVGKGGARVQA